MSAPKYFSIAGATGRQGGAVVKALLNDEAGISAQNIYAITRSAAGETAQRLALIGVNLVVGDLKDSKALFRQLDQDKLSETGVFLAQAHGPTEVTDAKALIDAALLAQVPYFVYSSVDRGGRESSDRDPSYCKTFSDKFLIEQYLREATSSHYTQGRTLEHTIIRPTWFADNADWGFAGKLCMTAWRDIMYGKRMQVTVTTDIGKWAVEAFLRPGRAGIRNEAVSIASDEVSFHDVDSIFRHETGKPVKVTYAWLTWLMAWMIKDLHTMFAWINERPYGADIEWQRHFIEPTSLREWVRDVAVKR